MSVLRWSLHHPQLIVGAIVGDVRVAPAGPDLATTLQEMAHDRARGDGDEATRTAIRDLLRGHGYKPTGRGKPASEFLAGAAARGELQSINNIVDINNLVSLESGLPISVFDRDRADAGDGLELRLGHPGETFVFNASGQSIDVGGLICVARVGGPAIGNPVKDSMAAKVDADTRRFLAVIYGSSRTVQVDAMQRWCARFANLTEAHANARNIATELLIAVET